MAMLEKHRNALYNHFAPQLGEEVTQALMSTFPSRDVEEPVTKADLDMAMTARKADLATAIADLRAELKGDIADLRAELEGDIADLRAEFKEDLGSLRADIQHALNRQLVIFTTLLSVGVGILLRAG